MALTEVRPTRAKGYWPDFKKAWAPSEVLKLYKSLGSQEELETAFDSLATPEDPFKMKYLLVYASMQKFYREMGLRELYIKYSKLAAQEPHIGLQKIKLKAIQDVIVELLANYEPYDEASLCFDDGINLFATDLIMRVLAISNSDFLNGSSDSAELTRIKAALYRLPSLVVIKAWDDTLVRLAPIGPNLVAINIGNAIVNRSDVSLEVRKAWIKSRRWLKKKSPPACPLAFP